MIPTAWWPPERLDDATGKVIRPIESTLKRTLDPGQLDALRSATKVRIYASFDTKDGQRYKIYNNYMIDVKLIADFVYEN